MLRRTAIVDIVCIVMTLVTVCTIYYGGEYLHVIIVDSLVQSDVYYHHVYVVFYYQALSEPFVYSSVVCVLLVCAYVTEGTCRRRLWLMRLGATGSSLACALRKVWSASMIVALSLRLSRVVDVYFVVEILICALSDRRLLDHVLGTIIVVPPPQPPQSPLPQSTTLRTCFKKLSLQMLVVCFVCLFAIIVGMVGIILHFQDLYVPLPGCTKAIDVVFVVDMACPSSLSIKHRQFVFMCALMATTLSSTEFRASLRKVGSKFADLRPRFAMVEYDSNCVGDFCSAYPHVSSAVNDNGFIQEKSTFDVSEHFCGINRFITHNERERDERMSNAINVALDLIQKRQTPKLTPTELEPSGSVVIVMPVLTSNRGRTVSDDVIAKSQISSTIINVVHSGDAFTAAALVSTAFNICLPHDAGQK